MATSAPGHDPVLLLGHVEGVDPDGGVQLPSPSISVSAKRTSGSVSGQPAVASELRLAGGAQHGLLVDLCLEGIQGSGLG